MDSRKQAKGAISRRSFLIAAGAGGVALAADDRAVFAADSEKTLKIGFISPRTGALAGFGEGDGYVLDLARKALADGVKIGSTTKRST
jgi:branched-chain amino acid transport system substrate-binding protein